LTNRKVFFGILVALKHQAPEKTKMDYTNLRPNQDVDENGLVFEVGSLYGYFQRVKDSRKPKGKLYPLAQLLVLMMLAKLGGEDKPSGMADWIANRIEQLYEMKILHKKRAPSHMTYRRVLSETVKPEEFESLIHKYHQGCLNDRLEMVFSMDGKTVRGTIPTGELRGTHLLSIYVPEQGLVLAEAVVDRKENEIVVAPKILKHVNLQGAIVLGDAMHAQREASDQIVNDGGEYIWTIKGNQPRTHWAIEKLFVHEVCNLRQGAALAKHCQMASQVNKGHGRIEKRTILISTELNDYLDWPHLAQVFRIERIVWYEKYKGRTRQVVYGLTSLTPAEASPGRLLALVRQYWGIENGLHYRRDVTLQEDATRLTVGNAGHNMAIFNNLVIGLAFQHGFHNLAKARRLFNAQPARALSLILSAESSFL
jgi:predicted transposase YbfD/YdcC